MNIQLPDDRGVLSQYSLIGKPIEATPLGKDSCRVVLSAAHVVANSFTDRDPSGPAVVDWEATMAYRHELWSDGLGVADAILRQRLAVAVDRILRNAAWASTGQSHSN